MPAVAFDTLAYAKEVEEAGFTRQQAEAFAWAQKKLLQDVMSSGEVASKSDLNDVYAGLKEDIQNVRTELKEEIQSVRAELKEEIQNVRAELKEDIQNVRAELKEDIQNVRTELKEEIANTKHEILKWTIATMVAQSAFIVAVIAFLR